MFIKGRKKSSYTLSESNVSNNINKDVLIKSTSSRSSSKNFELDLNPTFSEQCKSIVKIEAFKDLIQETSLLKENTKVFLNLNLNISIDFKFKYLFYQGSKCHRKKWKLLQKKS